MKKVGPKQLVEMLKRFGNRKEYEALVLRADGPPFARARTEGRLLSIAEAADLDSRQRG